MEAEPQVIVIRKKGGHTGHHGGAWKVAYADFVTAMMSLFIVLWLMNSTPKQTQEAIAGYFNDPKGTASKMGSTGTGDPKASKSAEKKDDMAALKLDLTNAIAKMNLVNKIKKQIEITVTDEGLRIELVEDEKGTFFEVGKAKPTATLGEILKVLSSQLKDLPNSISIEGYTDAQPYANSNGYGNWELSTDRANEARREMQNDGIRPNHVSQVRGFADQRLHFPDKPYDAANRRISLVVQNLKSTAPAASTIDGKAKPTAAVASAETGPAKSSANGEAKADVATPTAPGKEPSKGIMARAMEMFPHKK